jgi:phosphatidate cytidylyltransferase
MSPIAALHDPVFRSYVGLVLGLLAFAGTVLAFLQFVCRFELASVWKTYRSWLWMAPLAAAVIFAGRGPFIIGVMALAVLSFKEFAIASGLERDRWLIATVSAGIVAVGVAALIGTCLVFAALAPLALILVLPILQNRVRGAVQRMSLGAIAFLYLGWMFGHLGFLANSANAYGYLCYLIFATEVNDVAAFAFGKIFGRHPLRSEISPRKTWEGALGALAVSMMLPWLLRFSFPFFGPWQLILTGLIVGIGGPLGDLSLSVIKRDLGTKDWGAAIPGHGGILDRIDSLIFVAPLFMQMAGYYHPGG